MKTVLITGCSSGFGLEIARFFLARDWQVIATMRTPRADVLPPSDRLRVLALDVTNPDSIREAVEAAGPIDVLVNNAGFGAASPGELVPLATVRELFETNTIGTIALTQAVLPQFRQRKAGVVVNVTSSVTLKSIPLIASYTASKAAVNAFTESMALELGPSGILVNGIAPGSTLTEGTKQLFYGPGGTFNSRVQEMLDHVPLGRPGTTDEIAVAALFLADPENSYMNGHILVVDGGWIAGYHRQF